MEEPPQNCYTTWSCQWKSRHQTETCPLHDPNPDKSKSDFSTALSGVIANYGRHHPAVPLHGVIFPASLGHDLFGLLGNGHHGLQLMASTICGPVNFSEKLFEKTVNFNGVTFKQPTSFQHAQFNKTASFIAAIFEHNAAFADAIFEESVYFDEMVCPRIELTLAQFKSMVSFRGTSEHILFRDTTEVVLDEARFFRPDLVRLAYVDFKRCSLLKTDLRGIDFSGVRWCEKGMSKHVLLYTREPEEQVRLELESAYRQIRQSYEDRRDYGRAGAFYFGEMEQKWKGSKGFLATLYRLSSSYGHSPGRAFVILLLLLITDAAFIALWGVKPVSSDTYNLLPGAGGGWRAFLETWWIALCFYVLKTITFSQPSVVPSLPLADVLSTLMRIVISVQVALFVLAVNRKFKR